MLHLRGKVDISDDAQQTFGYLGLEFREFQSEDKDLEIIGKGQDVIIKTMAEKGSCPSTSP